MDPGFHARHHPFLSCLYRCVAETGTFPFQSEYIKSWAPAPCPPFVVVDGGNDGARGARVRGGIAPAKWRSGDRRIGHTHGRKDSLPVFVARRPRDFGTRCDRDRISRSTRGIALWTATIQPKVSRQTGPDTRTNKSTERNRRFLFRTPNRGKSDDFRRRKDTARDRSQDPSFRRVGQGQTRTGCKTRPLAG